LINKLWFTAPLRTWRLMRHRPFVPFPDRAHPRSLLFRGHP
jgi:hypothetical protein